MQNLKIKNKNGFTSMIALLLANIFLVVGLSVFNIALREIILSSGARESLFAFYAADAGMECALYWDINQNYFSNDSAPVGNIDCSGQSVAVIYTANYCGTDCSLNTFDLSYLDTNTCASVEVIKKANDDTEVKSFGRNMCNNTSSKKRVERAWEVNY